MPERKITINRAPVLTLWAAVVAERLGFERSEALSLGKAVAGLTAQTKGRRLGIYTPSPEGARQAREEKRGEEFWIEFCGRPHARSHRKQADPDQSQGTHGSPFSAGFKYSPPSPGMILAFRRT